jgi:hypothetical protein
MFRIYQYYQGNLSKLSRLTLGNETLTKWNFNSYDDALYTIHELWKNKEGQYCLVDNSSNKIIAMNFGEEKYYEKKKI